MSATGASSPVRPRPPPSAGDPRPRSIWSPTSASRARSFATRAKNTPDPQAGTRLDLGARAGLVVHAGRLSDRLLGIAGIHAGGLPAALRRHAHAAGDGRTHARVLGRRHARAGGAAVMAARPMAARQTIGQTGRVLRRPLTLLALLPLSLLALPACNPHLNLGSSILWSARHETGDLSEWTEGGKGGHGGGHARHLAGRLDRLRPHRPLFGEADQRRRLDERGRAPLARGRLSPRGVLQRLVLSAARLPDDRRLVDRRAPGPDQRRLGRPSAS